MWKEVNISSGRAGKISESRQGERGVSRKGGGGQGKTEKKSPPEDVLKEEKRIGFA